MSNEEPRPATDSENERTGASVDSQISSDLQSKPKTASLKKGEPNDLSAQGTVIIPRGNQIPAKRSSSILDLSQSAIHTRGVIKTSDSSMLRRSSIASPLPPLTPEEEADLINQQTVISKKPLAESDPLRTLTTREMGRMLAGHTLGTYALSEFVGGGGMGAVFRATDMLLNRTVAIKVLAPSQARDEETLRRFKNEAQSAARLDHENIGRVYNVGEDQGWHYIIFEFIEGENLRDYVMRQGPLSLVDNLTLLTQLADALAHASSREVVHRDIKPSNVIITPEGRAKLVDMGLARLHQVDEDKEDLTASGVTLGTFDYISPEQARDPRLADVRSDIYSLGCTLYFMLTGRPPFPKGTVLQKLLSHQADMPPDPRLERADLPDSFIQILQTMMAKSPNDRYQSPEALHADLRALGNAIGLEDLSHGQLAWGTLAVARQQHPWWYSHLPWAIPVLLSLVALFGVQLFTSGDASLESRRDLSVPKALKQATTMTNSQNSSSSTNDQKDEKQNTPLDPLTSPPGTSDPFSDDQFKRLFEQPFPELRTSPAPVSTPENSPREPN
jgi:serine/threonine protein kinase